MVTGEIGGVCVVVSVVDAVVLVVLFVDVIALNSVFKSIGFSHFLWVTTVGYRSTWCYAPNEWVRGGAVRRRACPSANDLY